MNANASLPFCVKAKGAFQYDQDIHSRRFGGRRDCHCRGAGRCPAISRQLANGRLYPVQGRDADTVRVPGTARYRQMRVCVSGGPIRMRDVDVRFRNGGHQDIGTRQLMRAGTCTRTLDLRGSRRDVTAVRLKYTPLARGWIGRRFESRFARRQSKGGPPRSALFRACEEGRQSPKAARHGRALFLRHAAAVRGPTRHLRSPARREPDASLGYRLEPVVIEDPHVVRAERQGGPHHRSRYRQIARRPDSGHGVRAERSRARARPTLMKAAAYSRIEVRLESGRIAFVYVAAYSYFSAFDRGEGLGDVLAEVEVVVDHDDLAASWSMT